MRDSTTPRHVGSVAAKDVGEQRGRESELPDQVAKSSVPGGAHRVPPAAARRAQPKVLLADAVRQLDGRDRHGRCRHGLQAVHGRPSSLNGPVIVLNDVVQVAVGSNHDVTPEGGIAAQTPQRAATRDVSIERDLPRAVPMIRHHGLPEEGLGSGDTAVRPQQEVGCPVLLVDGSVEIGPLSRICTYISSTRQELPVGRRSASQRLANSGTKRRTQRHIVDGQMVTPRSAIISVRSRRLRR